MPVPTEHQANHEKTSAPAAPVRIIALDLDGTLIDDHGIVSDRNRRALHNAEAAGVEVVFATGRRHSFAMQIVGRLEMRPDAVVVSSNGAVVRTASAEHIESQFMDRELALELCGHLQPWRDALVLTFDKLDANGQDTMGALVVESLAKLHESIERWVRANERFIKNVVPIEDALQPGMEPPIQMMLCGRLHEMREAMLTICRDGFPVVDRISVNRTEYPERDLGILDIMPKDCSKGSALRRLAALRGVPMENVMAIGDNWNDQSMLEVAGRPVVMANASSELLAIAADRNWLRTASNNHDGFALAVEKALGI